MTSKLWRYLPACARRCYIEARLAISDGGAVKSYAQEGEDMILREVFAGQDTGFYVDVGAHHPKRFSNTYYFYRRGWRGINIDAMPGSMEAFKRARPRDINLQLAVAKRRGQAIYFVFDDSALNTFDEQLARARAEGGRYRVVDTKIVATCPLGEILSEYVPHGQRIDLMTIDVEGLELEVLHSNDWQRFRPRYLLVECLQVASLDDLETDEACRFLKAHGYYPFAKTLRTVFYQDGRLNGRVAP